jgi:hypothetical protein
MSDYACRLKRSMQHYPLRGFDNASPEKPICFALLVKT